MVARGLGVVGLCCSVVLGCSESGTSPAGETAGAAGDMAGAGAPGSPSSTGGAGGVGSSSDAGGPGAAGEGPSNVPSRACDPSAAFGSPRPLEELNTGLPETGARLTSNELAIVFERDSEIFFAERATVNEPFGEAVSLDLPHEGQGAPWLSDDQLTLFFEVTSTLDTVLATRADRGAPFTIEESFGGYTDPFVAGGPNGTLYVEQNRELEFASLSNWIPRVVRIPGH